MVKATKYKFARLPLALAIITTLQFPALAQDADTKEPTAKDVTSAKDLGVNNELPATKDLEKITVTGSLIKRAEYQSTSPVQVISVEKRTNVGLFDTADFIQTSSIAAGSTQINNQFTGAVIQGGIGVQTVSLRGLGANRSLVLLDGQRPGPAGTRGQVGAFDLNVIPSIILDSIEIVKDGSSSIYGSDAVAGVVNLLTKKSIDKPIMTFRMNAPQHGGGEQLSAAFATGRNFENGNIIGAIQWDRQYELTISDRDFFECSRDMVYGANGQRIDSVDRSIIGNTPLGGCQNFYANAITDYNNPKIEYAPSPDGSTIGPFPGYKPIPYPTKTYANSPQAYYVDVLNFSFLKDYEVMNRRDRLSLYGASGFSFDKFNWKTQWLYNRRQTKTHSYRQFFPVVYNQSDKRYYEPIMPYPDSAEITVDYFYGATKFDGLFKSTNSWGWEINATYTLSDGKYVEDVIQTSRTGDRTYVRDAPPLNYFDPGFLNGERMNELVNATSVRTKGKTTYGQATANGILTGNLFSLPAGEVAAAAGVEYRRTKINDQPDPLFTSGDIWGSSAAQVTKGKDNVREAFLELDVPILKGKPGFESLSINASGRTFKYASVSDSDNVWKIGLNWQIIPSFRVRGTVGTSYRAPGLYELYLANQTGYVQPTSFDPCIRWSKSTNTFLRKNCAAAGIPGDYAGTGGGGAATIYTQGGKGTLKPETSRAKTLGLVWTPEFANINIALDYFDYEIRGEIARLNTSTIVGGCYGSAVYPNAYCEQIVRNSPNDPSNPNKIEAVYNKFININSQRTRGYDLQVNYDRDFSFGTFSLESQLTYTIEDITRYFDSAAASGNTQDNQVGTIGRPKTVGSLGASLKRGDWTFSWYSQYVSSTQNLNVDRKFKYWGYSGATRDIKAGWQALHNASIGYDQNDWGIVAGVRNLFDKEPDTIASGAGDRIGNIPQNASQYDWFGRTLFVNVNYKF